MGFNRAWDPGSVFSRQEFPGHLVRVRIRKDDDVAWPKLDGLSIRDHEGRAFNEEVIDHGRSHERTAGIVVGLAGILSRLQFHHWRAETRKRLVRRSTVME